MLNKSGKRWKDQARKWHLPELLEGCITLDDGQSVLEVLRDSSNSFQMVQFVSKDQEIGIPESQKWIVEETHEGWKRLKSSLCGLYLTLSSSESLILSPDLTSNVNNENVESQSMQQSKYKTTTFQLLRSTYVLLINKWEERALITILYDLNKLGVQFLQTSPTLAKDVSNQ